MRTRFVLQTVDGFAYALPFAKGQAAKLAARGRVQRCAPR
jgi:hypothetical protein